MVGNVHMTTDVPTAATNGLDVFYNPSFIKQCSMAQVRGTVGHENLHKALLHMVVYKQLMLKEGKAITNAAMDYVINRYIVADKKKRIKEGKPLFVDTWDGVINYLYDPLFDDEMVWDTPRVLEYLKQQSKGGSKGEGNGGGNSKPGGNGVPGNKWEQGSPVDGHDWAKANAANEKEVEGLQKEIEDALRQGEHLSRKLSGNTPREIGELLKPAVNWREALRDFVLSRTKGDNYATFARPNRRYMAHGIYMPAKYNEQVERIGLFIDTSGSIGPEDIREVMSEIRGCVEAVTPKFVDIMYWDTSVVRHEHYEDEDVHNIMASTKPEGGGGTSPSCVVKFAQERGMKFDVVVWLSDGEVGGDWGEGLDAPAFWVISSRGRVPQHLPHVQLPRR
jgi:predicted metal-dependent peptidase